MRSAPESSFAATRSAFASSRSLRAVVYCPSSRCAARSHEYECQSYLLGDCPCAFCQATDVAYAFSLDGTTSRHIPSCTKMCDGMWSAWNPAGAIRAYARAAGSARIAWSLLSNEWIA